MDDGCAVCADPGSGCAQLCAARRGRGPGILPAAGLEPCRRNGHWQCHCGCHEPGVLYPQPWRWRYGNLWQLHEPGLYPGGRVPAHLRAGYLRGHLFRPDHLPGLLLLRGQPGCRPQADLYHPAQCICQYDGRPPVGYTVLCIYDLCQLFYHHCCVPEHSGLPAGKLWLEPETRLCRWNGVHPAGQRALHSGL